MSQLLYSFDKETFLEFYSGLVAFTWYGFLKWGYIILSFHIFLRVSINTAPVHITSTWCWNFSVSDRHLLNKTKIKIKERKEKNKTFTTLYAYESHTSTDFSNCLQPWPWNQRGNTATECVRVGKQTADRRPQLPLMTAGIALGAPRLDHHCYGGCEDRGRGRGDAWGIGVSRVYKGTWILFPLSLRLRHRLLLLLLVLLLLDFSSILSSPHSPSTSIVLYLILPSLFHLYRIIFDDPHNTKYSKRPSLNLASIFLI